YRLRLLEELSGVHDTFHVSNLKKCLADASLHMPLDEIKIDKTFCFVEEPVENSNREVISVDPLRHVSVPLLVVLERDRSQGIDGIVSSERRSSHCYGLLIMGERDRLDCCWIVGHVPFP
ncbi:hypothetical protein Tco_0001036, partial [Tanacetum coccineum]